MLSCSGGRARGTGIATGPRFGIPSRFGCPPVIEPEVRCSCFLSPPSSRPQTVTVISACLDGEGRYGISLSWPLSRLRYANRRDEPILSVHYIPRPYNSSIFPCQAARSWISSVQCFSPYDPALSPAFCAALPFDFLRLWSGGPMMHTIA